MVTRLRTVVYFRAMKSVAETSVVHVGCTNPRRNLPAAVALGRRENNFVAAFGETYVREAMGRHRAARRSHAAGRELNVAGFGIADFVWVAWQNAPRSQEGRGLGLRVRPRRVTVLAFEMKLKDWRRALAQAVRYRYFADAVFVVLPPPAAACARKSLVTFRDMRVGLWSFDKQTERIHKMFTPRRSRPLSPAARQKAIAILSHKLKIPPVS